MPSVVRHEPSAASPGGKSEKAPEIVVPPEPEPEPDDGTKIVQEEPTKKATRRRVIKDADSA